ncbi:hypothetical protein EDD21DRAFT_225048 [Dissophora ornata]|nr:hypothetical protein EDD21DRAFT_225048 [Dissophora ornata]
MNSPQPPAYSPYGQPRGGYNALVRGRGRGAPMPPVRSFNRKLTLNNTPPASPTALSTTPRTLSPAPTAPSPTNPIIYAPVAKLLVRPPVLSRHLSLVNNKGTTAIIGNSSSPSNASSPKVSPTSTPPTTAATTATSTPSMATTPTPTANSGQQWIQSKGKNMSMMNPASYKKTMEAKEKSIRSSKEKKFKLLQARAKMASNLRKGIVTMGGNEYSKSRDGRKLVMRDSTKDNIVINGALFEMDPRGNKLVRKAASSNTTNSNTILSSIATTIPTASGIAPPSAPGATPKQFSVGGVVYVRTTNGNLVRATLVKDQLLKKRAALEELKQKRKNPAPKKQRPFCKFFTRFGQCQRGPACPFMHSRTHLAICKKFLRGICPNTASTCKLSHTPSPHTTPACSHFQRAACTKDDCLYPHIRINPQAPICRPFATEGWCEAGINCKDRHVWICPDFDTPTGCKKKCGLAHLANGGIRVKKSAEEMERERQERGEASTSNSNVNNKRKRSDSTPWSKSTGRYMNGVQNQGQDNADNQEQDQNGTVRARKFHDEDFVPFDFDNEEEEVVMMEQDEDESEVMGDFDEGDQEVEENEDEEDDEEDVSSDEVESDYAEDVDNDELDYEGEDEEQDVNDDGNVLEDEDEDEDEDYDEELQRFYEEQDQD